MFPPSSSVTWRPLPSTGSSQGKFPGFAGTMGRSDSLRTLPPRFVGTSRDRTTPCACVRLSVQARRRPGARSFAVWQPPRQCFRDGAAGRPKFLGNLRVPLPCSSTPAGPAHQAIAVCRHGPRAVKDEGSPRVVLSGLNSMAWALAVYASPRSSPDTAQDALPTAGQALSGEIGYPQGSYERFPRCSRYISSPFPKLAWRNNRSPDFQAQLQAG